MSSLKIAQINYDFECIAAVLVSQKPRREKPLDMLSDQTVQEFGQSHNGTVAQF